MRVYCEIEIYNPDIQISNQKSTILHVRFDNSTIIISSKTVLSCLC